MRPIRKVVAQFLTQVMLIDFSHRFCRTCAEVVLLGSPCIGGCFCTLPQIIVEQFAEFIEKIIA